MDDKKAATEGKLTLTTCRLPPELLARLQAVSTLTNRSQGDLMRSAVEQYLGREIKRHRMGDLVSRVAKQRLKVTV